MSSYVWLGMLSLLSPVSSAVIQNQPTLSEPSTGSAAALLPNFIPNQSGTPAFVVGGVDESLQSEDVSTPCITNISDTSVSKRTCNLPLSLSVADAGSLQYKCDNRLSSLQGNDCRNAWQDMPTLNTNQISLGNRTASHHWDVPLPFRFISQNGKCVIEVDQTDQGYFVVDGSTGKAVAAAAWEIIRKCADTHESGGTVSGLGKKGRLSLTIKEYEPNVDCEYTGKAPTRKGPTSACTQALNKMEVSRTPQVFGKAGGQGVQVALPISISDDRNLCKISVDIEGTPMLSQWYDVWADAVAVTGMCVAGGKWGNSTTSGDVQSTSKITVSLVGAPIG